jgi:single-stranded-DNA-specific exonuclease
MKWIDPPDLPAVAPLPGLHPLVAHALAQRGITTAKAAQAFLDPNHYKPRAAGEIPGLTAAAERVERAIRAQEPICVWGDFDVDGQTSTTILVQTLRELGADVTYHIPVRATEGHGVNVPVLTGIIDGGARLILTCDTGIGAHHAVDYARSRGVEVIITDHHDLPESLPQAAGLADPKLLPEGHPLSTLSGSGVAYKLAEELYTHFGRDEEAARHLDLACLGLVADLARLTGDARYLVQRGLDALRNTRRLGLQILMEVARLKPENLTEEHIGYEIGPRLNALGRLGDANPAVDLFTTADPARARTLVMMLEGLNAQRQLLTSQVTQAAEALLKHNPSLVEQPVIVLSHADWPGGIVGLAASRLVERYRKPAIVFTNPPGEPARGSARSVEGVNISAAIARQKDMLLNFGGHPMAAGLSLQADRLPEFRRRLGKTILDMVGEAPAEGQLELNEWLNLGEVSPELAGALESLAPYGPGNEKLVLATRNLHLLSSMQIGRNKEHLKLELADEMNGSHPVLWWNGAGESLPEGRFDLAYSVRAVDWRGKQQVQIELVDLRPAETEAAEIAGPKLEVVDYRNSKESIKILEGLRRQASTLIWAEGEDKKGVDGKDRTELAEADRLVIWTIPPSPEELRLALEKVHPKTVYLFAVTKPVEPPVAFLSNLIGLLKYTIHQRNGKATWSELAAATAQKPVTVRNGLGWLVALGEFNLKAGADEEIFVSIGTSAKNPESASKVWGEIQALLSESAAYRANFKRASKESLLPKE